MVKYLRISSHVRRPFLIYMTLHPRSHLNFLICEENFVFFFISAVSGHYSEIECCKMRISQQISVADPCYFGVDPDPDPCL
jgi:hypothetical protein